MHYTVHMLNYVWPFCKHLSFHVKRHKLQLRTSTRKSTVCNSQTFLKSGILCHNTKKNGTSYCLSEERIQEQAFKSISCTWNWIANARNERKSFTYPEGCLTQKSGLHTRQTNRKTETHCRNITVQCWLFMVSGCRQIMSWTKLFANCCPQMVTAIGIEKKKKNNFFFELCLCICPKQRPYIFCAFYWKQANKQTHTASKQC